MIKDIEERHHQDEADMNKVSKGQLHEDREYLLSLVKKQREALRKISVQMPGSRDNELVLYYERIAKEALKE